MTRDLATTARLFDVANSDDAVIDVLEGVVRTMKESRRAKAELAAMSSNDLRELVAFRAQERAQR